MADKKKTAPKKPVKAKKVNSREEELIVRLRKEIQDLGEDLRSERRLISSLRTKNDNLRASNSKLRGRKWCYIGLGVVISFSVNLIYQSIL